MMIRIKKIGETSLSFLGHFLAKNSSHPDHPKILFFLRCLSNLFNQMTLESESYRQLIIGVLKSFYCFY